MQPVVSVCMTTYNQDKYIAEAIESVLAQKTSYAIQLVIGEDHSTDKTLGICQHFAALYPNILLLHQPRNLGLARNLALTWKECKGQYIAMLEGDDFWYSPYKLQRQAELMEQHKEYSMCFTTANVKDEADPDNHREFPYRKSRKISLNLSNIIRHNLLANCSVMYRGGLVPQLPSWMLELPYLDLALHCLHSQYGDIGYIPEHMAIYRLHKDSSFECKSLVEKVRISTEVYAALAQHLPHPYCEQARQTLILMYAGLILHDLYKMPLGYRLGTGAVVLEELDHLRRSK